MKSQKVIDANIILRYLTSGIPNQAAACEALLLKVKAGQEKVFLPDLVIANIIRT